MKAPSKQGAITRSPSAVRPAWFRQLILGVCASLFLLSASYHYLIYLSQPDQPHHLTLLDDLFCLQLAGLIALLGLALGRRLLGRFTLPAFSRLERGALAIGLGWGMISLFVLALGLAHLLYSWLLIALLGAGLLLCGRDLWQISRLLAAPGLLRPFAPVFPASRFARLLAAAALLNLPLVLLLTFLLPYYPRGYDVYQYHWAVPKLYLFHHAIYAIPGWAHANFPFNTEMLNTLALAFDAPVAALMMQATFGLLALVLLGGWLFRQFGVLVAWLATAICLASPLFTSVLSSGYAEPAVTYYGIASVMLVLAWLRQPTAGQQRSSSLLVLAGFFAGCGLGAKYWEGQIVAGVIALLFGTGVVRMARHRQQGQPARLMVQRLLLPLLSYGAAAFFLLLPWLLKDWALLGNPIYPFLWGGPGWDATRTQMGLVTLAHFGPSGPFWQRLPLAFFDLFLDVAHAGEVPYTPPNILLLLVVIWPLLALLYSVRAVLRRSSRFGTPERASPAEREITWVLLIAAVGYAAWVLSGASVDRYALPWVMLLSAPAAVVLARACQVQWQVRPLLRAGEQTLRKGLPGAILFIVLLFGPGFQTWTWWQRDPLPLLTGQVALHSWESSQIMEPAYWETMDYLNTEIPRDARILLLGRGAGYFLEGRDYVADSGDDWIPYLETEGQTPSGMLAILQHDGFRYVVYEEHTLNFIIDTYGNHYIEGFLPAFRQFLASTLQEVKTIQGFHIYAVPLPSS